jgi:hypothetical protein
VDAAAFGERDAWFCPRCGARSHDDADACAAGPPGPEQDDRTARLVVHRCGVATPDWSTFCVGCGARLVAPGPPRPPRKRDILPPGDGSPEGLSMSRHVLMERQPAQTGRAERVRFYGLLLAALLALGLMARALAIPGDDVLALVRAHRIPGRGGDVAVGAIEGLHHLLAPPATPRPTS